MGIYARLYSSQTEIYRNFALDYTLAKQLRTLLTLVNRYHDYMWGISSDFDNILHLRTRSNP